MTDFAQAYPDYATTAIIDQLRATDFADLDATGDIYLDYTGGGLSSRSQLAATQWPCVSVSRKTATCENATLDPLLTVLTQGH